MARQILRRFGDECAANADSPEKMLSSGGVSDAALPLVRQRLELRRDAYLSAAGHKRPGIRAGIPVDEAEKQAQRLTAQIEEL